ncbi:hypothetical protein PM082_021840 [Marasmius tenuissimus]|nr:hypothetical protein PM082_021840 [Marasmius tenuissimus]
MDDLRSPTRKSFNFICGFIERINSRFIDTRSTTDLIVVILKTSLNCEPMMRKCRLSNRIGITAGSTAARLPMVCFCFSF